MADLNFIGEVSAFSEKQQEFVKNVLKENGFKSGSVEIQSVGKLGDNYVANIKRITAERNGEKLKLIAKVAPTHDVLRQSMNTMTCFANENVMYSDVLPKISQLEKDAGIPVEERLKYAKFYGSFMEEPYEIILLEDLGVSDFVMLDRLSSLKDNSVRLVLQNFAKLHAASYALKHLEPETFEEFSKKLVNLWEKMVYIPNMEPYLKDLAGDIRNLLDEEKYLTTLDQVMSEMLKEAAFLAKTDKGKTYSVINQGDPWTNNILFKVENDKSIDCCMIDYQLSKEGSPVADISYMIYNCTDYEQRSKHFNDWLNYYHSELQKYLKYYKLSIDSTYPRPNLDADLKRYAKYSLAQSIMLSSVLLRESKDSVNFKEALEKEMAMEDIIKSSKVTLLDEVTLKRLKNKVVGLIDTVLELGYL